MKSHDTMRNAAFTCKWKHKKSHQGGNMTDKSSIGWNEGLLTTANSKLIPTMLTQRQTKVTRPATLKQRLTTLLLEIFEGHEEHLGLTPD
jgi:hypothetical protein